MQIRIRRTFTVIEERREEAGRVSNLPLRRVAAVAVVENPYAGRYIEDLKPMIDASATLGKELGSLALSAFGDHEVQSYGKGGIVGVDGEQEHANALLTTAFANPIRVHQERRTWYATRYSNESQGRRLRPLPLRRHVAGTSGRTNA